MHRAAARAALLACSWAMAFLVSCGHRPLAPLVPPPTTAVAPPAPAAEPLPLGAPLIVAPPDARFAKVDAAIRAAIDAGKLPGCVLVVGRHDEVLLRRAYGSRALLPAPRPMTLDTVFDLASLTKPLATATSVMILVERGTISLSAPAARYLPELSRLPPFTVEQLLTHTSGLPAETPVSDYGSSDRTVVMQRLAQSLLGKPRPPPGEKFLYSDVGFVILQAIVERVSGLDLATFSRTEIWEPLGMTETGFLPDPALRARAAPTEQRDGAWMQGAVHDPRAFAIGGVAGHAGLFSTADDLSRYARAMLGKGVLDGRRVLEERTFDRFVARHETTSGGRALGWDRDSRFATHRSALLSGDAFGHGGFTGTAMWIDPGKDLYVVFLSNRVHPDGKGAVNPLIAEVATLAIDASETKTGIDVLRAESFARLERAHVALITNTSARTRDGTLTLDAFRSAPNLTLSAIFSPEHGITGVGEGKIADANYHGVPIYSLYGERAAPTAPTLDGVDTLVFDLQDAGVRFYTYASTMKLAMKVAAARKLRFVVLDRPNPLGGIEVAGPVLDAPASFVNHHALPIRHGMTMGELARLFAADDHLDLVPEIVRMEGWRRHDLFDRTGLTWVSPSPNLRTVDEVVLYAAVGVLESTHLSVGRGTETPFEVLGAPTIDGEALAKNLEARGGVPGLTATATTFTPNQGPHAGKSCGGLRLRVTDRARFDPMRAAVMLALAIHDVAPAWDVDHIDRMLQSPAATAAIAHGIPRPTVDEILALWKEPLAAFVAKRQRFLLY